MLAIIYLVLSYWAVGKVIYADKVVFYSSWTAFFAKKMAIGLLIGWILIPIAILKIIFGR